MNNRPKELCKRVKGALHEWYNIPTILVTRAQYLPELEQKYRTWIDNLEQTVKDLQDELELQARQAPQPPHMFILKPCPFCGSNDIGYQVCPGLGQQLIECSACGISMQDSTTGIEIVDRWNSRL